MFFLEELQVAHFLLSQEIKELENKKDWANVRRYLELQALRGKVEGWIEIKSHWTKLLEPVEQGQPTVSKFVLP